MQQNRNRFFTFGLGMLVGGVIGFLVARTSFRTEVWVDYDSGEIRRVAKLGPLTVREDEASGFGSMVQEFGSIPVGDQRTGLTGTNNWRIAFIYPRNSKKSDNFEGGNVVNLIHRLQIATHIGGNTNPAATKESFLRALVQRGIDGAAEVVREVERSRTDALP